MPNLEDYHPDVQAFGLYTRKDAAFHGDVDFQGNVTNGGLVTIGRSSSVADATQITNGLSSLASTGGVAHIKNGTYSIGAQIPIIGSGKIIIEGESQDSTVLQASQSIFAGGSTQHFGILSIKNHTTPISKIIIRNLTIDCNRQLKTQALTITGGTAAAGTSNILIENCTFKNMGQDETDTARAVLELMSGSSSQGTFGNIDNIEIRNCTFDYSEYDHLYFLGSNFTNVHIHDNLFTNNQRHTINISSSTFRSNKHWYIVHNRFIDTKQRTINATVGDIFDGGETGIFDLKIKDNYFSPHYNIENQDEVNIKIYSSWGVEISSNFFNGGNEAMSIGKSFAGAYYKIEPDMMIDIHHNIFYKLTGSMLDPDSNIFAKFSNNKYYYTAQHGYGGYSRHWPTVLDGEKFYNCGQAESQGSVYHQAAVETNGDGLIVRNCEFIDDQLLANPATAPTLSQVAGGSLGARTYYVKYTWVNNTGETLASNEANISMSANNRLKVTLPTALPYPTGATQINIYVGTLTNTETLQDHIDVANQTETGETNWFDLTWTEPTTGLVSGAALPISNTTHHTMLQGIYEAGGSVGLGLPNTYYNNHFYGIAAGNEIIRDSAIKRIVYNNYTNPTIAATGESELEKIPYAQGNVTGATTFNMGNGEVISATLTGNITVTLTSGFYVGQTLTLILTQDGTGNRTATWPSNFKKAGGTLTLSTGAGAIDRIVMRYDGTNWVEVSRALNVS